MRKKIKPFWRTLCGLGTNEILKPNIKTTNIKYQKSVKIENIFHTQTIRHNLPKT